MALRIIFSSISFFSRAKEPAAQLDHASDVTERTVERRDAEEEDPSPPRTPPDTPHCGPLQTRTAALPYGQHELLHSSVRGRERRAHWDPHGGWQHAAALDPRGAVPRRLRPQVPSCREPQHEGRQAGGRPPALSWRGMELRLFLRLSEGWVLGLGLHGPGGAGGHYYFSPLI